MTDSSYIHFANTLFSIVMRLLLLIICTKKMFVQLYLIAMYLRSHNLKQSDCYSTKYCDNPCHEMHKIIPQNGLLHVSKHGVNHRSSFLISHENNALLPINTLLILHLFRSPVLRNFKNKTKKQCNNPLLLRR